MEIEFVLKLAQIIGTLAVVVSVGFLALETRHSNRNQQLNAYEASVRHMANWIGALKRDPELASLFAEGLADFDALDTKRKWRFGAMMQEFLWAVHAGWVWDDRRIWIATDSKDELAMPGIRIIVLRPGFQTWWEAGRQTMPTDFADHIDGLMRLDPEQDAPSYRLAKSQNGEAS